MKTRRTLLLACLVGAVGMIAGAPAADAQGNGPQAEVLIIHGTNCDKPFTDPQIGEMPPLRYNCYKVVDKKLLPMTKGQSATMPLPNGRTFQITYSDLTADKKYKLAASISQPDGKGFLKLADVTAEANKRFHVGGFAYQGGALVLAIKIVP